jgi:hypothetical protein
MTITFGDDIVSQSVCLQGPFEKTNKKILTLKLKMLGNEAN